MNIPDSGGHGDEAAVRRPSRRLRDHFGHLIGALVDRLAPFADRQGNVQRLASVDGRESAA